MSIFDKKKLFIFDKDGTLTPSKSAMQDSMAKLFMQLLTHTKVAVISGLGYTEFETQILNKLPTGASQLSNLILLPTSGTRLYLWRGSWCEQYAEHLSLQEKESIMDAISGALTSASHQVPEKIYGNTIEDRGSQITFSALGQKAPLELKVAWDPNHEKRKKIISFLQQKIPGFDLRIGGTTSIDITRKGVNKSYGIRKLEEYLHMPPEEMVYVGDSLFYGGNDYPVKATGIDCIPVKDHIDTERLIESWLRLP